jgi:leader peptidase (prepilin peptidase) / N-methyltransferase
MIDPNTAISLLVFWLFLVGGAVGSFLNVVVYRLPLGLSLIHPPSHCPKCGNSIRWYDNVPMLGWIALRGRCRDCKNPISARYPIVEAITAAMFAAVAAVEMTHFDMPSFNALYPQHILLLCTLLCAALIEFDGNRTPISLFLPAFIISIAALVVWPTNGIGLVDALAGAAVGGLAGAIARWTPGTVPIFTDTRVQRGSEKMGLSPSTRRRGLALSLICTGLILGWQGVGIIAIATGLGQMLIGFLGFALARRPHAALSHEKSKLSIPPTMTLGAFALAWILIHAWLA